MRRLGDIRCFYCDGLIVWAAFRWAHATPGILHTAAPAR